jgi:hypothetical protein
MANLYPAAAELTTLALTEIEQRYGPQGETPKAYHNAEHTEEVIDASQKIGEVACQSGRIDSNDIPVLMVAAAYHDIEHTGANGRDERVSADRAQDAMRQQGEFDTKQIAMVRTTILATRSRLISNRIVQEVTDTYYMPNILADADLAYLGKPFDSYMSRALLFLEEKHAEGKSPWATREDFMLTQAPLLGNHRFHTREAAGLFPNLKSNMRRVVEEHVREIRRARGQRTG